jgi:hypothetical protein
MIVILAIRLEELAIQRKEVVEHPLCQFSKVRLCCLIDLFISSYLLLTDALHGYNGTTISSLLEVHHNRWPVERGRSSFYHTRHYRQYGFATC